MSEGQAQIEPSDLTSRPTIMIVIDEHGDPQFGSNDPNMDLIFAISMLEMVQAKMVAIFLQSAQTARTQAQAQRPQILVPSREPVNVDPNLLKR